MAFRELPVPEISEDHDVLVRVKAVGVCGSDIHYFTGGKIGSQVIEYPFRIGHECAGEVEAVGAKVTRVHPGDLVAMDPCISCGSCSQCRAGRPHTCLQQSFLGCPGQVVGCMAEYIIMPAENCYPVKGELTPAEAAFVEPLSIGCYTAQFLEHHQAQQVAILGAGSIGLSVLLSATVRGISRIYATDKLDYRLAVARKMGAGWTGNPDQVDIAAEIREENPEMMDAVVECCGQQDALDQAIDLLKPGGALLIVGIPENDRISFDISKIRRKEIVIQNIRRQNRCMQPALDLVEQRRIDVKPLLTHSFSLFESSTAFDLVTNYRDQVIKAMIEL